MVYFYPLDFTFVCPTEIIAFSERIAEFREINCEVVGVSTDSHFSHLAWISQPRKQGGLGGLAYPLVSDFNKTISRDYGVLIEEAGIALRGLFIVDPTGVVRQMSGALWCGQDELISFICFSERPAGGAECRRNSATDQGFPVC